MSGNLLHERMDGFKTIVGVVFDNERTSHAIVTDVGPQYSRGKTHAATIARAHVNIFRGPGVKALIIFRADV